MTEFSNTITVDVDTSSGRWYFPGQCKDTSVSLTTMTFQSDIPLEREDIDSYVSTVITRIRKGTYYNRKLNVRKNNEQSSND